MFDRILASLHQAALDDAYWPAASALIDEAIGATGNSLAVSENTADTDRVLFSGFYRRGEHRPDLAREYFESYFPYDERLPRLIRLRAGRLAHVPDLYTARELKTSFVYNEGLLRLGSRNGLNVRFDGPDDLRIIWATGDPVGTGGWQSAQLRLTQSLLPHIRQFVLVRQALAAADALRTTLTGLLDNSRIGVIHLDRGGRLLTANAPALEVLRRDDGLFDRDGSLHASLPADNSGLLRLLKRALPWLGGETPAGGSMTIQRPTGRPRLELHVHPVGGGQADFGGRRTAALVLVVDPDKRPHIEAARVATILGLTPSEGRVAALLAEGKTVREIAAVTGYRASYVYWLLKQTYKKQGLSGQVALVQRVLSAYAFPRR